MASTAETTHTSTSIDTDFKRSLLNSIALFRDVEPEEIGDLLTACGRLDIEKGRTLLSPSIENRCVYVVLSGELAVHIGSLDSRRISTLPPGSCAGEMSLIDNKDPSAYVVATEDSHLMVISYRLLWDIVERSHAFAKNLLIVLSERVRSDNAFIADSLNVIRRAEQNAQTDALTGLGNRHWMNKMFEREVSRALQAEESACLLMIDVDDFKTFNDQYGHIAGDQVLGGVAQALTDGLRPRDLIVRFGGDEFAVLLPEMSIEQGIDTAERLRECVRSISPEGLPEPVTVSIGVTQLHNDDNLSEFLHRADSAMYAAKAMGRDLVSAD